MKENQQSGAIIKRAHNFKDITGQQFGRLTALYSEGNQGTNALWMCRCSCGNLKAVSRPQLRGGYTKSCGCLYNESRTKKKPRRKFHLPSGESARRNILKHYKSAAQQRGLTWEIEPEDFFGLIQQPCHYCGAEPSRVRKVSGNGEMKWNGLDRVNNAFGYFRCNVVPCCHICNHAKCEMSAPEFVAWIQRAAAHLRAKQETSPSC